MIFLRALWYSAFTLFMFAMFSFVLFVIVYLLHGFFNSFYLKLGLLAIIVWLLGAFIIWLASEDVPGSDYDQQTKEIYKK